MIHLGEKCKNLKTIDISGCIMLTDQGILQLTQVSDSMTRFSQILDCLDRKILFTVLSLLGDAVA